MKICTVDLETYWSVTHSLTKMSPIRYCMHPETEIISCAFKFDNAATEVIFGEEAVIEYNKLKNIAPSTPGLREKLRAAQLEVKKSKRKDYYALLGITKDNGSSEVKKAYRKMAVIWHPDKHSTGTEEEQKEAEAKFKDIGEAYAVLSDPSKRAMYDEGHDLEEINQGGGGGGGMGGMN